MSHHCIACCSALQCWTLHTQTRTCLQLLPARQQTLAMPVTAQLAATTATNPHCPCMLCQTQLPWPGCPHLDVHTQPHHRQLRCQLELAVVVSPYSCALALANRQWRRLRSRWVSLLFVFAGGCTTWRCSLACTPATATAAGTASPTATGAVAAAATPGIARCCLRPWCSALAALALPCSRRHVGIIGVTAAVIAD